MHDAACGPTWVLLAGPIDSRMQSVERATVPQTLRPTQGILRGATRFVRPRASSASPSRMSQQLDTRYRPLEAGTKCEHRTYERASEPLVVRTGTLQPRPVARRIKFCKSRPPHLAPPAFQPPLPPCPLLLLRCCCTPSNQGSNERLSLLPCGAME